MTRAPQDVRLVEAKLPEFGVPEIRPELPPALFAWRLRRLIERVEAENAANRDAFAGT